MLTIASPETLNPNHSFSRRRFLKLSSAGCATFATGCSSGGLYTPFKPEIDCKPPPTDGPLRVDMHCHLMNLRDADREAFIHRYTHDEWWAGIPLYKELVGAFVRSIEYPAFLFTQEARGERQIVRNYLADMQKDIREFCKIATDNQHGLLFSSADDRVTGFLSNRARNAALMLQAFPEIDLFTPSIVDFSEGDPGEYSSVVEQAMLYSMLSVASGGRMLPLISFHPERSYVRKGSGVTTLLQQDLAVIEMAVERFGVVGVKVHPSTGFSPDYNKKSSCQAPARLKRVFGIDGIFSGYSGSGDIKTLADAPTDEFHDHVDLAMGELFKLCRRLDVPVLTHNSRGLSGDNECQEDRGHNHPALWLRALKKANLYETRADQGYGGAGKPDVFGRKWNPDFKPLRICLGHFADGFQKPDENGVVRPIDWLQTVLEEFNAGPPSRVKTDLFLDLSFMDEWFDETTENGRVMENYRKAFHKVLEETDGFAPQVLYGSDWHMPPIAEMGTQYRKEIEGAIPDAYRESIMGKNAMRFLGLDEGGTNFERVSMFMKVNGVDVTQAGWCRKHLGPEKLGRKKNTMKLAARAS
jgi:predicted TIM-barrel fold metal-dependent hydrolase